MDEIRNIIERVRRRSSQFISLVNHRTTNDEDPPGFTMEGSRFNRGNEDSYANSESGSKVGKEDQSGSNVIKDLDAPMNADADLDQLDHTLVDGSFKYRLIPINGPTHVKYGGNEVSTAKYTVLSFLPLFLFEQFRRYSNIFFLTIALLQQIPDVSPTGRYTTLVPLLCILSVSALKEIIEDIKRHRADSEINNREIEVLRNGDWTMTKWKDVVVGDFVKVKNNTFFPSDIILYSSSEPHGICYIETSNLDGETNLKIRQGLARTSTILRREDIEVLKGLIECEHPNRHLYEFSGSLKFEKEEKLSLGPDQILLRGAKLMNTTWVFGQVVYAGHETKLLKNSTKAPLKRSTVDRKTNTPILALFGLLLFVSVMSALFSLTLVDENIMWYLPRRRGNPENASTFSKFGGFLYDALTFLILYNNLIPISLTVTVEVVRFIQAMFINMDLDMYYAARDTPATARTSNLNEELGQVSYVFSDKTGTLTQNIMEFKGCSVGGLLYLPSMLFPEDGSTCPLINNLELKHETAKNIEDFLVLLSVCHTVIPEYVEGKVVYHAASPDERALVEGGSRLGYSFKTRTPTHVTIDALGRTQSFEILNVIEFTSTRKRMSVIVRNPENKILIYTKGADSMIFERLNEAESLAVKEITESHLHQFATEGLRTLCCAVAELTPKQYEEWRLDYLDAATAIEDREEKIAISADKIERNLRLIGATAIEDRLQDHVPATIASLIEAKIHVWVLTGDKQETAINIGYSSRLLNESTNLIVLNESGLDDTRNTLSRYTQQMMEDPTRILNSAVIVDGKTLRYSLVPELRKDFFDLCCRCRSVIVCRASPIQKAEIVEYVSKHVEAVTLAIGDGANDVAMIQKAHVGIGISGFEGLQAACASDYAIAQFHYLSKLLFVHGAWNHDRMVKLIFYSFYKNICLYIIELWFAIYSAWSGQVIFDRWTIGLYNMFFTAAQPIAMGVFERNCSKKTRLEYPLLYHLNRDLFSMRSFLLWIVDSIFHSICLFWISYYFVGHGIVWSHGKEGGYLVLGNFIYSYVVVAVSLKAGLETRSWTLFTHIAIWGSIALWLIFFIVYSFAWQLGLPIGADMTGVAYIVLSSPLFWIGFIVVPCATLLVDVCIKTVQETLFPTLGDRYRASESRKDDSRILSEPRNRCSETARLLRNVRRALKFYSSGDVRSYDFQLSHGYAFSQEENGVVTQSQLIRTYDTSIPKPEGM